MQIFAWLAAFLFGIGATFVVLAFVVLLRFLFGRSSRLDRVSASKRHRSGVVSILSRIVFFIWSFALLTNAAVFTALLDARRPFGCDYQGLIVTCPESAGGGALASYLGLPDFLAANTGFLLEVLWTLPAHFGSGFSNLPAVLPQLAIGLIGPVLMLLALWGLVKLLGDIRRLWRDG